MTQAQVIAEALGTDVETVREAEYQPGQWTQKLFTLDDFYYCAMKSQREPHVTDRQTCLVLSGWAKVEPVRATPHWVVWRREVL